MIETRAKGTVVMVDLTVLAFFSTVVAAASVRGEVEARAELAVSEVSK
jgi:hypothetical protein